MDFVEYVIKHDLLLNTWNVEKWEGKYLIGNKSERHKLGAAILARDCESFEWSQCAAMSFPSYAEAAKALETLP